MKVATLCFVVDEFKQRVLLGLKKRGFGQGKFNGFGGKLEPGETPEAAVVRELEEEAGISVPPEALTKVAILAFQFPHKPTFDHLVHVFTANRWLKSPIETEEMRPQWFLLEQIPFDQMWDDDRYWLPKVLNGEKLKATFTFRADNETVETFEARDVNA